MKTVPHVDLESFAGDWFVLAHIPMSVEKDAFNAVESYRMSEDGSIDIGYTFNKGGLGGKPKVMTMTGKVHATRSNAEWRVRPFWPLSLAYLVLDLDAEYRYTEATDSCVADTSYFNCNSSTSLTSGERLAAPSPSDLCRRRRQIGWRRDRNGSKRILGLPAGRSLTGFLGSRIPAGAEQDGSVTSVET